MFNGLSLLEVIFWGIIGGLIGGLPIFYLMTKNEIKFRLPKWALKLGAQRPH